METIICSGVLVVAGLGALVVAGMSVYGMTIAIKKLGK
jgi:hypothetical protein